MAVPVARYVDDMFRVDDARTQVTGGMCCDIVCRVVGATLDPDKAEDTLQALIVLGALVEDHPSRGVVTLQITHDKARDWSTQLLDCVRDGRCDAGLSAKFAGRLSFA